MSKYHRAGQKLAAMMYGSNSEDAATASGLVTAIDDVSNPGYGNFQRLMCKYAAEAFREAGQGASFEYCLFKEAAQAPQWFPEMDKLSNAVVNSLGVVYLDAQQDEHLAGREVVKNAAMGILAPSAVSLVKKTPDLFKTVAGLGVAGGAGLGSLIWLMNRHSKQDSDKAEALRAKVKYYNKLTSQIKQELGEEPSSDEKVEEIVHDVF